MAWDLNANAVLATWINEDAPVSTNPRFVRLLSAAKRELKRVMKHTDDWFTTEIASNPDFQDELDDVASAAIQRSWEADPSGAKSNSWSELAFSRSTSRESGGSILVTFQDQEISRLLDITASQDLGNLRIIRQIASPNFNISSGSDFSWTDNLPVGVETGWRKDYWL